MSDRTITTIAALLRKAEKTDNDHEAEAYLAKAQELATRHSIDLAVARLHGAPTTRSTPEQRTVTIGTAGKRGLRTYVELFLQIAAANQVRCDVARNSTIVYAYGFTADLDAVEVLYASLVVQMVRAGDAFISTKAYLADTVQVERTVPGTERLHPRHGWIIDVVREEKPVHATTARLNFHQAFARRIGQRLQQADRSGRAAAEKAETGASVALAIRSKEAEVTDLYRQTSTAAGRWRGTSTAGYSRAAGSAGDAAGRRARIGENEQLPGRRRAIGGDR